ncbi:hypothetical protein AYO40_06165 [Planctomycetaceae bacterium SCGC AG-212-D15]|nr:hypothetical protein AYO40_06165 [Planctomycetaceae bacterium SCGC AG-212-D15]
MVWQAKELLTSRQVPKLQFAGLRSTENAPAIWGDGYAPNPTFSSKALHVHAVVRIPHTNAGSATCEDDESPIGRDCHGIDRTYLVSDFHKLLSAVQIPKSKARIVQPSTPVIAPSRHEEPPVRRNCNAVHVSLVADVSSHFSPSAHVPESDGVIAAPRDNVFSVR